MSDVDVSDLPIGLKLMLLRRLKGYKQYELAEMLGVSSNRLSEIEKGRRHFPKLEARALEILESDD